MRSFVSVLVMALSIAVSSEGVAQTRLAGILIEAEDFDGVESFETWQTVKGRWYAKEHLSSRSASGGAYAVANEFSIGAAMEKTLDADLPAGRYAIWLRVTRWFDSDDAVEVELNGAKQTYSWMDPKVRGYRWLRGEVVTAQAGRKLRITALKAGQQSFGETPKPPCKFLVIDAVYIGPADEKLHAVTVDSRRIVEELVAGDAPEKATPQAENASLPPPVGNLIENGGFEAGVSHGWGSSAKVNVLHGGLIAEDGPAQGRRCLRSTTPDGRESYTQIWSRPYRIAAPGVYTLSAHIQSAPSVTTVLGLVQCARPQDKPALTRAAKGTDRWERLAVTDTLSAGEYYVQVSGGGPFRLDGVQLEAGGKPTEWQPAAPVEIGLISEVPGQVFFADEPVKARLLAWASVAREAVVNCAVYDLTGRLVLRREVRPALMAGETVEQEVNLAPGLTGIFRAEAEVTGMPRTRDEMVFSVLPKPRTMGIDHHSWLSVMPEHQEYVLSALQRAGFKWSQDIRFAAAGRWCVAEPEPGRIVWQDAGVAMPRKFGMEPIMLLHVNYNQLPKWVEPSATNRNVPKDVNLWKSFVSRTVAHYKNEVKYWQFSDDIHHFFSADEHAMLLKATYEAAKEADPGCTVIGWRYYPREVPGWEAAMKKTEPYSDILYAADRHMRETYRKASHNYRFVSGPTLFNFPATGDAEELGRLAQERRETPRRIFGDFAAYAAGVGYVDALFLYKANLGVKPSESSVSKNAHEFSGALQIGVACYRMLDHFTRQADCLGRQNTDPAIQAHLFQRPDAAVALCWAEGGQEATVDLADAAGLTVYDAMGNALPCQRAAARLRLTLADMPCVLVLPGRSADALRQIVTTARTRRTVAVDTDLTVRDGRLSYDPVVRNNGAQAVPVRVATASDLFPLAVGAAAEVDLGPVQAGETRVARFPLRYGLDRSVEFKPLGLRIQAGERTAEDSRMLWLMNSRPVRGALTARGVPADWSGVLPSRIAVTNASAATRRMLQVRAGAITGAEEMTQGMAPILRGNEDLSVRLYSQYDPQALYLAADVTDDVVETGDQVEFLIAVGAGAEGLRRLVCPAMPAASAARLTVGGQGAPREMPTVVQRTAAGYRVEVAIPWKDLGAPPEAGRVLPFDAVVSDWDGGTAHARMVWAGTGPQPGDPADMGFLVLGK